MFLDLSNNSSDYIRIAMVSKSYDNKGEVMIKIVNPLYSQEDFTHNQFPLFILMEQTFTPFFIERASPKGNTSLIVKFTTIHDLAHSEELVGKAVYCRSDQSVFQNESTDWLVGFALLNQKGKIVGNVTQVIEYPSNICLEITPSKGESFLVPFHEDLVIEIDADVKIIKMQIPEGIL